ncbi:MAG: amidohydrolase family protein [Acidobacteriota bacterium]|nr:amidohydrolase family protein [Acidobacteriota bacterium]
MGYDRRAFLKTAALWSASAALGAEYEWGGPVLDIHYHPGGDPGKEVRHADGSGVSRAVLLPGAAAEERAKQVVLQLPDRFARFTNADVRQADAEKRLRAGVESGALGFGELKYPVACDGPEMRRVYDLAAELRVPVLLHFQENQGHWNTGLARLPAILKAFPRTTFIGHANSWWAHVSAAVDDGEDYPKGPIEPGGLTDHILAEYPNVYGDLSANSGRNMLQRDPEFAAKFVERHRAKLMFGSDCGCKDGHGAGQPQPPLKGLCTARETLGSLKKLCPADLFRQVTWGNGMKLLKLA